MMEVSRPSAEVPAAEPPIQRVWHKLRKKFTSRQCGIAPAQRCPAASENATNLDLSIGNQSPGAVVSMAHNLDAKDPHYAPRLFSLCRDGMRSQASVGLGQTSCRHRSRPDERPPI